MTCKSAAFLTFYNGPDRPDPGYVPDGAACGTGKVTTVQKSNQKSNLFVTQNTSTSIIEKSNTKSNVPTGHKGSKELH